MNLEVWVEQVNGPVGILERFDDKTLRFTYSAAAVASGNASCRISMALPVREEAYSDAACVAFFSNLLFEGRGLDGVVDTHGLDRDDYGQLLYHLGADCPGAISVMPEGAGPGKRPGLFPQDYVKLSQAEITAMVRSLHFDGRLPADSPDPSPVAGVQPKLALVFRDGSFFLPKEGSGAPSTHILKVSPHGDARLTRHEVALLSVAADIGLDVTEAERHIFHDERRGVDIETILSTRFDRIFEDGKITRLHSEDFCQALGLPRRLKYEREATNEERRFSAAAVGKLSAQVAAPAQFRLRFFQQTLFNLAVGNTDNHAKNSSIIYRGAAGELAPLYDVVPATMDDQHTHAFAFDLGRASFAEDLTKEDLLVAMSDIGFAKPRLAGPWIKLLKQVAVPGIAALAERGDKQLADGIAAQLEVVSRALEVDLAIPERDYFPRAQRDEKRQGNRGGWGGWS
ncbi:HipA domain-containing protein [Loktanella sp. DJP18]|uniref:HipA domain-containing protein n=1 Tax=Loktanella sp. DJP18 TaxID=3409788 RepID=UPI003BB6D7DA